MAEIEYNEEYTERLSQIIEALRGEYGKPEPAERSDPVDSLITTILSQNTNDSNRDVAKRRLDERFDSYSEILEADVEEVEEVVRPAGLGPTKAERIQTFLSMIVEERDEFSLEHVKDMDREEAKKYLTKFPGVGPKTAAVTLCFAFGMPVMPVDTHVHRLARRFELIPDSMGREKAHEILERETPDERIYEFHINLIKHGREVCTARNPSCEKSPLYEYCLNCQCRDG